MSEHKKITTSAEVYAVIFARHRDQLKPFSSFSNPDGRAFGGGGADGRMDTEYGFDGCDFPIIGISTRWPISRDGEGNRVDGERIHSYWLCLPIAED